MRLFSQLSWAFALLATAAASEQPAEGNVEAVQNHTVPLAPPSAMYFEAFESEAHLGSFRPAAGLPDQNVSVSAPLHHPGIAGELGLTLHTAARHYALVAPFAQPISLSDDAPFVLQYEVKLQQGLNCGGAYLKLLNATEGWDGATVDRDSPYVIMFGPDRCGSSTDKVHFILRWRNPATHAVEEKHLVEPPRIRSDRLSHLYTLVIRPDDSFTIKIDNLPVREGSLRNGNFSPAILPEAEMDDPEDFKPLDWVDEEKMPDLTATKPEDWDEAAPAYILDAEAQMPEGWLEGESETIADPSASKPAEWDEEEDGEFMAPLIPNPRCESAPGCGPWQRPMKRNPAYRGKWSAPLIPNPGWKGVWAPRRIPNPAFFEDSALHRLGGAGLAGIAIEVWTMDAAVQYDNILVSRSEEEAAEFARQSWAVKYAAQDAAARKDRERRDRLERKKAADSGGWKEKLNFAVTEFQFFVADNQLAVTVAMLGLIAGLGMLFWRWVQKAAERGASAVEREERELAELEVQRELQKQQQEQKVQEKQKEQQTSAVQRSAGAVQAEQKKEEAVQQTEEAVQQTEEAEAAAPAAGKKDSAPAARRRNRTRAD